MSFLEKFSLETAQSMAGKVRSPRRPIVKRRLLKCFIGGGYAIVEKIKTR